MTPEELQALCREWQERLRLQDWDIEIRFAPYHELDGGGKGGDVAWFHEKRMARIRILEPDHQLPAVWHPYDVEQTVVHELVHLHLVGFGPGCDSPEMVIEEIAVHRISEALVRLKRLAEGGRPDA